MGTKYSERKPCQVTKDDVAGFQPGDYLEVLVQLPLSVNDVDYQTDFGGYEEPQIMTGVLQESEPYFKNLRDVGNKTMLTMPNGQLVRGSFGEVGGNIIKIMEHRPLRAKAQPFTLENEIFDDLQAESDETR